MVFYKQTDSMDCGPTCLRMVAKFYKFSLPIHELRLKSQVGREGVSLLGISEAAEAIGFRTNAVRISFDSLVKDAKLPAIIHWNQNHYVVLYRINKKKVFIADPAIGLLSHSHSEFRKKWISAKVNGNEEGIALLLEPTPEIYRSRENIIGEKNTSLKKEGIRSILIYLKPYKKLILQLFIGIIVSSFFQLFIPFLTQSIIDVGIANVNLSFVYIVLLAQLALFTGSVIVDFIRSWILLHISTRINISILTDFLIKLMKLPISFFDSKNTGDILQRMNDHNRIESFLTGSSLNTLFSLFNLLVFSIVLLSFDFAIFSVFAISNLVYSLWIISFLKKRKEIDYKRFAISSQEQSAAIQLIQGMQDIKLNGVEKHMRWRWENLRAKIFKISVNNLQINQWQQGGAHFINEIKNIVITFLSAQAVIEGDITLGTMLAIQFIIGQLNSPIEQMLGFIQSWQTAKISLERLNEINTIREEEHLHDESLGYGMIFPRNYYGGKLNYAFDHSEESTDLLIQEGVNISKQLNAPNFAGDCAIKFNNVSFTYDGAGNSPALKNISFEIPNGKTTAIVGVSGSGKTTLLKLLLKFYEPQSGSIYLYNTSFNRFSPRQWRSNCGVVMQESFIFSDSIARNIAVGDESIDIKKLRHAIHLANIDDLIESLPLGLNTRIGTEGSGISMGQKQRILIARAIYRNPLFLFFDEATNSLDANNESIIVRNLNHFFVNRTVVVVAHRLSTVKNADQIIVMDKGSIKEIGNHSELVKLKGHYFSLIRNQIDLGL